MAYAWWPACGDTGPDRPKAGSFSSPGPGIANDGPRLGIRPLNNPTPEVYDTFQQERVSHRAGLIV